MKAYASKIAASAVAFALAYYAKPLYATSANIWRSGQSERSIAASLLFRIESQQAVANDALEAFKLHNPATTVHNDCLPNSVFQYLVKAYGLKASRRGQVHIGTHGTLRCEWKSVGELREEMKAGSVAYIVAAERAAECSHGPTAVVSLEPFKSSRARTLAYMLE